MPRNAKARPKMKWKAAPPELVRTFEEAVGGLAGAQLRKMFGYPAAFVNGNMLGGLFQDTMMLRLSSIDLATFQAEAGARLFEPMPGRVMRQYAVVPQAILASKPALRTWVGKAAAYTRSLPPKSGKAKRKKAGARR